MQPNRRYSANQMNMQLISFHVRTSGVEGLAAVTLPHDQKWSQLAHILFESGADELFYLATCNRVEFLVSTDEKLSSVEWRNLLAPHLSDSSFTLISDNTEVIRHLLSVALSRDSVVFGESQILGQFKHAYEQCLQNDLLSSALSPLLNTIIAAAKSIRTEIGLNQFHNSISTVAGAKILKSFARVPLKILFVGSGETNMILARYLQKRGPFEFYWTSRTLERSQTAAQMLGGVTHALDDILNNQIKQHFDVISVATHSELELIQKSQIQNYQPRLLVDLAVPPNVSHRDALECQVPYYGIEQLNAELSLHADACKEITEELDQKIQIATQEIYKNQKLREAKSLLMSMRGLYADNIDENEKENLQLRLSQLNSTERAELLNWTNTITKTVSQSHLAQLQRVISEG